MKSVLGKKLSGKRLRFNEFLANVPPRAKEDGIMFSDVINLSRASSVDVFNET